jgi:hypothetical protein
LWVTGEWNADQHRALCEQDIERLEGEIVALEKGKPWFYAGVAAIILVDFLLLRAPREAVEIGFTVAAALSLIGGGWVLFTGRFPSWAQSKRRKILVAEAELAIMDWLELNHGTFRPLAAMAQRMAKINKAAKYDLVEDAAKRLERLGIIAIKQAQNGELTCMLR